MEFLKIIAWALGLGAAAIFLFFALMFVVLITDKPGVK